jgi:hypothetical protein
MDQQPGTADDNKLFLFGMPPAAQPENYWPNFPQWGDASNPYDMNAEPLKLVHQGGGLYLCEWLECFHSAHPQHGQWQLGGSDPDTQPGWSIGIERISASAGLKFWDPDADDYALQSDGATLDLGMEGFEEDLYNENGILGAWHLHKHVLFFVNDPSVGIGETFSATIRAFDSGTTGFGTSEAYTLQFVTVPEPATLLMMMLGGVTLFRRK